MAVTAKKVMEAICEAAGGEAFRVVQTLDVVKDIEGLDYENDRDKLFDIFRSLLDAKLIEWGDDTRDTATFVEADVGRTTYVRMTDKGASWCIKPTKIKKWKAGSFTSRLTAKRPSSTIRATPPKAAPPMSAPLGGKPTEKTWYPKYVDTLRRQAIGRTENYIDLVHGGSRDLKVTDPGFAFEGVGQAVDSGGIARQVRLAGGSLDDVAGNVSEQTLHLHRDIRWVHQGMPAYILDADTVTNLSMTRVSTLRPDEVKYPYHTFLMVLDDGTPLYIWDEETSTTVPVKYIFVHTSEGRPRKGGARVTRKGGREHDYPLLEEKNVRHLFIELMGSGGRAGTWASMPYNRKNIGEWIKRSAQQPKWGTGLAAQEDKAAIEQAIALVVAFGMYLTIPDKEAKRAASRRKTNVASLATSKHLPKPEDWIVTPSPLDPKISKAVRRAGPRSSEIRKLMDTKRVQHVVSGHFKPSTATAEMPHGIYIEPYWRNKGPKASAKVGRKKKGGRKGNPSSRAVIAKYLKGL